MKNITKIANAISQNNIACIKKNNNLNFAKRILLLSLFTFSMLTISCSRYSGSGCGTWPTYKHTFNYEDNNKNEKSIECIYESTNEIKKTRSF